jgi:DNA-directed RNA polymerase subunit RPC12/RpoP
VTGFFGTLFQRLFFNDSFSMTASPRLLFNDSFQFTMINLTCPHCQSKRLKRSRTRSFFERLAKTFDRREYRCIDCGWRGKLHVKPSRGFEAKNYTPGQIIFVVVVIILAVLALVYWLGRESDRASEASAAEPQSVIGA